MVIHYPETTPRRAVPILVKTRSAGQKIDYIWGFAPDGETLTYVRAFPNQVEVLAHLNRFIFALAASLSAVTKATTPSLIPTLQSADEAQAAYDQLLRTMQTGSVTIY